MRLEKLLWMIGLFRAALETHLVMLHNHSKDELTKKRLWQMLPASKPEDFVDDIQSKGLNELICDVCHVKFK